jgi:hypothetical protein
VKLISDWETLLRVGGPETELYKQISLRKYSCLRYPGSKSIDINDDKLSEASSVKHPKLSHVLCVRNKKRGDGGVLNHVSAILIQFS